MSKILVTGGAGFIGNNFIRYWLKNHKKDKIINLDKLTYAGHISSTRDFVDNPNYKFIRGSITNRNLIDSLLKDMDMVVHFAAESHVDRSIKDSNIFIRTNILGTQNLLESALKHKIKHFHYVSTDEVFGTVKGHEKFKVDSNYNPRNPYSASKAGSDHLVRAYYYTYGLPITLSNCSNNFGPYQDTEKFISRMITNLLEGKKVKIYGDGGQMRDWLYVNDHIRAIEDVIKKGILGQTYLVGGMTEDISNLEVAKKIINKMRLSIHEIEFVQDRAGHDRRYSVDWSKINKTLGWKPEYDFDNALDLTIDWYKNNYWWWQNLKRKSENFYKKT